jgi:phosphate transport system permease protein
MATTQISAEVARKRWFWRNFKDQSAHYWIGFGGIAVILAIVLIFFYLLAVTMPIFKSASVEPRTSYALSAGESVHWAMEEQGTVAARYLRSGAVEYLTPATGEVRSSARLPIEDKTSIVAVAPTKPADPRVAMATSDGRVLLFRQRFAVSYPNDVRTVTPELEYPLGKSLIPMTEGMVNIKALDFTADDSQATFAAITGRAELLVRSYEISENMMTGERSVELASEATLKLGNASFNRVLVAPGGQAFILASEQGDALYVEGASEPEIIQRLNLVAPERTLSSLRFLLGGFSLLVGDSQGEISQWFPVRDENNAYSLQKVRTFAFNAGSAVTAILGEDRRKGFLAANALGDLSIHYSSSERTVLDERVSSSPIRMLALSPRGYQLLAEKADGTAQLYDVKNEHPEISLHSLWQEVWYEGYAEPDYTWQSSAATNDFEPKFSLMPLTFGTFKAAFYAMLVAIPLAITGAIFTAQFMNPTMRQLVKPSIEIMEALPTVILGFLAGLWFAPFVEAHLPGLFSILIVMPLGFLLMSFLWFNLPLEVKNRFEGWEALILIPVVLFIGWFAIQLSNPMEELFFDGNIQQWMLNEFGIRYDQRNSLVVGIAMGFAVIPTIFSIAEDAIFSVPQHLIRGSLALGATSWQTLVNVVMPTASPAIFSAVMMGFGRAVGETMIVLMATGNTPVMDMSVFEGMRTLSANIAVEMPESEVDSSHYRVLFLAALVLFVFTFLFNTGAEVVRQRLRNKYSNL